MHKSSFETRSFFQNIVFKTNSKVLASAFLLCSKIKVKLILNEKKRGKKKRKKETHKVEKSESYTIAQLRAKICFLKAHKISIAS